MKVCPTCYGRGQVSESQLADIVPGERWRLALRLLEAARTVEAKMTSEARTHACDSLHEEHEELRNAIHTLDTTSAKPPEKP